jgi:hypothetical protein
MTAKEKAKEIFDKMYMQSTGTYDAKQCALIAVYEVINSMTVATSIHLPYWKEVKQEIQAL